MEDAVSVTFDTPPQATPTSSRWPESLPRLRMERHASDHDGHCAPWAGNVLAVNDDVDFMRLFGNLRVAFGRAAAGYTEWVYRIRLLLCH